MIRNITILGAGSWGVTLALLLSEKNFTITVWEFDEEQAQTLQKTRNLSFLPEIYLPKEIHITSHIEHALSNAELLVFATPSHVVREVCEKILPFLANPEIILLSVVKGIENGKNYRMTEVIRDVLPKHYHKRLAVLSGPSHAEEVSKKIPTSIVAASEDEYTARIVQDVLSTSFFRIYTSSDVVGVEMGGALKNIIAIATGICDGLNLGDNTKAALCTRGLVEITRLGMAYGADPFTFSGLSGMGDLIVTCMSSHSRNRLLGEKIGQGKTLGDALSEMLMIAEGVKTTESAYEMAQQKKIDMPITHEVYNVLFKYHKPRKAVDVLMLRNARAEKDEALERICSA